MTYTNADFARHVSSVARNSSSWAVDILSMEELLAEPVDPRSVAKFTDEIRERLDFLDRKAGRATHQGDK